MNVNIFKLKRKKNVYKFKGKTNHIGTHRLRFGASIPPSAISIRQHPQIPFSNHQNIRTLRKLPIKYIIIQHTKNFRNFNYGMVIPTGLHRFATSTLIPSSPQTPSFISSPSGSQYIHLYMPCSYSKHNIQFSFSTFFSSASSFSSFFLKKSPSSSWSEKKKPTTKIGRKEGVGVDVNSYFHMDFLLAQIYINIK